MFKCSKLIWDNWNFLSCVALMLRQIPVWSRFVGGAQTRFRMWMVVRPQSSCSVHVPVAISAGLFGYLQAVLLLQFDQLTPQLQFLCSIYGVVLQRWHPTILTLMFFLRILRQWSLKGPIVSWFVTLQHYSL